ncbi:MAG TPA: ATP-binding protein [Trebonia sp.]|nr:ATP-binding protein [Trebonia sp.]
MTTLRSVIVYLAATQRLVGIAYTVVQVIIWRSFYAAAPLDLAAPAVAVAWGAVMAVYLRRGWPSPFLACADAAVYLALALGAAGCVPPVARDVAFSWLVITMSGQLIVAVWYGPRALFVVLAALSPAAYWIGAVTQPAPDIRTLAGTSALLVVVGLAHAYGRHALYGRAAAADAALGAADQAASEQFAIMSATIERREHERLLHDTVLNTLTALARAGGDDVAGVVNRCRQDVALIEDALGDPSEPAAGPSRPSGGLLSELRAVAVGMRARGLAIHLEVGDGVPAVPAGVAAAISNAVREALSNVAAHAGTGEAWLRVRSVAPAADAGYPSRLDVFVRDHGAGFDLARVDPARLGLRRSIAERIADCGGQASVWSVPGHGTAVRLSWPASAPPGEPRAAGEPGPAGRARAYRELVQESLPW